jgi:benzoate-CoA ligase
MIKAGGIWVSPVEVETTLMKHPAVLECGVIGSADIDGLIKPKAYVVFKDGITVNDELMTEVKLFVKKSIAPYKFPRSIEQIDELPKTATGKIQRFKLRQMDKQKMHEVGEDKEPPARLQTETDGRTENAVVCVSY